MFKTTQKNLIAHSLLLESLDYDPQTGIFRWKKSNSKKVKIGDQAGCYTDNGYRVLRIGNVTYTEHRLAWYYVHGEWPEGFVVDHINNERADNRLVNLRKCEQSQNAKNNRGHSDSVTGVKGVYREKRSRKNPWYSKITNDGVEHNLGVFATAREAALAYNEAASRLHGEFACLVAISPEAPTKTHPCA